MYILFGKKNVMKSTSSIRFDRKEIAKPQTFRTETEYISFM
jgi:hypothetical protein